jgi:hypothetical protein
MQQVFYKTGLSVALFGLFMLFEVGLSVVGRHHYNQEQQQHGLPAVGYIEYITSDSFMEAMMENWESQFLQMFAYVILTALLYQQGSAESRKLDGPETVNRDPRLADQKDETPWPVRKRGGDPQALREFAQLGGIPAVRHVLRLTCRIRRPSI